MKQPTIMYEGEKCRVLGISWYQGNGKMCSVSFVDAKGEKHLAFDLHGWDVEGYNDSDILHLNLNEVMEHNGKG